MATGTTQNGMQELPSGGGANPSGPMQAKGGPLSGPFGVMLSMALLIVAGYLGYRTYEVRTGHVPQEPPAEIPVMYICSETGKSFAHVLRMGEKTPVLSPHSNKNTGYRAEKCYWTKDGKVKDTPTYVLLNEYVGKAGPTICPECGRLVEPHNKRPPHSTSGDILVPTADTGESKAANPPPTTQPAG